MVPRSSGLFAHLSAKSRLVSVLSQLDAARIPELRQHYGRANRLRFGL